MRIAKFIYPFMLGMTIFLPATAMACACCTDLGTMHERVAGQEWKDTLLAEIYLHKQEGWLPGGEQWLHGGEELFYKVSATIEPFSANFQVFKEKRYIGKLSFKYTTTTEVVRAEDLLRELPKNWRKKLITVLRLFTIKK